MIIKSRIAQEDWVLDEVYNQAYNDFLVGMQGKFDKEMDHLIDSLSDFIDEVLTAELDELRTDIQAVAKKNKELLHVNKALMLEGVKLAIERDKLQGILERLTAKA